MLCVQTFQLQAQNPSAIQYTVDNGLYNNKIYNISVRKDGYIYAGSDQGLFRFNGRKSEWLSLPELKGIAVTGLVVTPSKRMYGYTFSGQFVQVGDTVRIIKTIHAQITNVIAASDNSVWITGDKGVCRYSEADNNVTEITAITKFLEKTGSLVTQNPNFTGDGAFWFTNATGIYRFFNGQIEIFKASQHETLFQNNYNNLIFLNGRKVCMR
ncbi:MAG: hypothetical protein Fur0041_20090 [Bacteroidia bacterium]